MTTLSRYLEGRETENNDSFDRANLLSPDVPLRASFFLLGGYGVRDQDYYKVAAPPGSEVTFTFDPVDTYIGSGQPNIYFQQYVSSEAAGSLSGLGWWGGQPIQFGPFYTPSSGMVYVKLNSNGYGTYDIKASIKGGGAASDFPQYSLSSSSSSVDEGGTVSIKIATRDLASGTSIPYKISGVSAADLNGNLSGTSVFDASGFATVELTLRNDEFTEGDETLNIEAGGKSIAVLINDTSRSAATYSLFNNRDSVDEGSTTSFTLTTKNLTSGTSVPYTLSGVSAADISGGLSGYAFVNASGVATISVNLINDKLTEGAETLTVRAGGANASIVVNDTSVSAATYSLANNSYSVNEGSSATFTLSVTNVAAGTLVPYTLSGVSAADISGSLSGNAFVNSSGVATISVTLLNDNSTEGAETLTVTAGGASASTVVNDTSKSVATYSLSNNSHSVNEGSTTSFTLTTKNLASGTAVPYTLSGVSAADVSGGLSGTAVVNSNGVATISVTLLNDNSTEGAETLTVTAGGASASTVVNDTSKSVATYSLSNNSYSVNEGSTTSFTLTTKNLASGTAVPYTLSGVSAADVSGGLSGTAVVNSNGVATISVTLLNDNSTEGAETLTVTAGGASASTTVNDSSKASLSSATRNFNVHTEEARAPVDNLGVDDPVDMLAGVTRWVSRPDGGRALPLIGETYSGDTGLFSIPALDPDGGQLAFTITDGREGEDSSLFMMIPGTNQFRFIKPPDFNNPKDGAFVDGSAGKVISAAGDNLYTVFINAPGTATTYAVIVNPVNVSAQAMRLQQQENELTNGGLALVFDEETTINDGEILVYKNGNLIDTISNVSQSHLHHSSTNNNIPVQSTKNVYLDLKGKTYTSENLTIVIESGVIVSSRGVTSNFTVQTSGDNFVAGTKGHGNDIWTGTQAADRAWGEAGSDEMYGLGGNDRLNPMEGNDYVEGGEGDDEIIGSPGINTIDGGPGFDQLTIQNHLSGDARISNAGKKIKVEIPNHSTHYLSNVERISFMDKDVELSDFVDSSTPSWPTPSKGVHTLDVIVDIFGEVFLLKNLTEVVDESTHTIRYNETVFSYSDVDSFVMTVVRDGEFTAEFSQEIAQSFPVHATIKYSTVIAIVGVSVIDNLLLSVAGADGSYVS